MAKCDFCGKSIPEGTGKQYVMKQGKVLDFCSGKCEKNMLKLGRKARTTRWTAEYHKIKAVQASGTSKKPAKSAPKAEKKAEPAKTEVKTEAKAKKPAAKKTAKTGDKK